MKIESGSFTEYNTVFVMAISFVLASIKVQPEKVVSFKLYKNIRNSNMIVELISATLTSIMLSAANLLALSYSEDY
jgi:hypothetical protein